MYIDFEKMHIDTKEKHKHHIENLHRSDLWDFAYLAGLAQGATLKNEERPKVTKHLEDIARDLGIIRIEIKRILAYQLEIK